MNKSSDMVSDTRIDPAILLQAYSQGIFPMAESAEELEVGWYRPEQRGVLPLETFHLPRKLRKTILSTRFEVTVDQCFEQVIAMCAASAPGREQTWINVSIRNVFCELYYKGFAHSVEVWHGGRLCGGLYGLALGGAFFGESMFSRVTDASKVALVHLVGRMRLGGYSLLDTQFVTEHLARFGAVEITAKEYAEKLEEALRVEARWIIQATPSEVIAALG